MQSGAVNFVLGIAEHEHNGFFRLERREDGLRSDQQNDDNSQENVRGILAHYFCTSVCGVSAPFFGAGCFVFSCSVAASVRRGR